MGSKNLNEDCTIYVKTVSRWSNWNQWSECSASCGGGMRLRLRVCSTGQREDCDGSHIQSSSCNTVGCPPGKLSNK